MRLLLPLLALCGGCFLDSFGAAPDGGGAGATGGDSPNGGSDTGGSGPSGGAPPGGGEPIGGGGGSPGIEDCLDGADNDEDGVIDCADLDSCGDFQCVPSAQNILAYASAVTSSAECHGAHEDRVVSTCGTCQCTANAGTCTFAGSYFYETLNCTGNSIAVTNAAPSCNTGPLGDPSIRLNTVVSNANATCSAAAPTVASTVQPLCVSSEQGTCQDTTRVCVPKPTGAAPACVLLEAIECPAEYPAARRVFDGDIESCECPCGKTGEACAASFSWSTANVCPLSGPIVQALAVGVCVPLQDIEAGTNVEAVSTPACDATGVPPAAATQVLLCCEGE